MAITAGNSVLNRFAPPFCVNDKYSDGDVLIYDENCGAFINVQPNPEPSEPIETMPFVEYSLQEATGIKEYYVPWRVEDLGRVIVAFNGLTQHHDSFSVEDNGVGSLFRFDESVEFGNKIEITDYVMFPEGNAQVFHTVLVNPTRQFSLPFKVDSNENLIVTVDGIRQEVDAYEMRDVQWYSSIIFDEDLPTDTKVQFQHFPNIENNVVLYQTFDATGVQSEFVLPWLALGKLSLFVSIGGIKQQTIAYDLFRTDSTTTLMFSEILFPQERVEVVGLITDNSYDQGGECTSFHDNLGTGAPVYSHTNVVQGTEHTYLRSIKGSDEILVTYNAEEIAIGLSGTVVSTVGDAGSGHTLVAQSQSGNNHLSLKTFKAGTGIDLVADATDIYVSLTPTAPIYHAVNEDYLMTADNKVLGVRDSVGMVTITLPSVESVVHGEVYTIKDESGQVDVTIKPELDGQLIDGNPDAEIDASYGMIKVYTNGSHWFMV